MTMPMNMNSQPVQIETPLTYHDLRYHEIKPPTQKSADDPTPLSIWWWCVCGTYRDSAITMHHRQMIEGFFGHLAEVDESLKPKWLLGESE